MQHPRLHLGRDLDQNHESVTKMSPPHNRGGDKRTCPTLSTVMPSGQVGEHGCDAPDPADTTATEPSPRLLNIPDVRAVCARDHAAAAAALATRENQANDRRNAGARDGVVATRMD
jgi:hypothetical protein